MNRSGASPHAGTAYGEVRGRTDADGVSAFLGIPYAASPTGALRFRPPEPPTPWTTPRDAVEYGPTAPQAPGVGPIADLLPNVIIPGDDYLNLNVWTADMTASAPVMVFIHGGAFTSGSGAVSAYDGSRFARDGVVLVTINYRLGADGFLWFGEGTPNLGLLDQIAALTWVRDNIAGFGGDPGNVTVFGESAGAMSACALLTMPAAHGLFHRVIAQSGGAHSVIGPASARKVGDRLAAILGVEPTLAGVAAAPLPELLLAQQRLTAEVRRRPSPRRWGDAAANLMPFEPVVDGEVLPARPIDAITAGVNPAVDLMIGTNADEARLYFVPTRIAPRLNRPILTYLVSRRLRARSVIRTYRGTRPGERAGDLFSSIMTDWLWRIPALRVAEARPRTHVYEFGWWSPSCDGQLGACHAAELGFVFDNLDDPALEPLLGPRPPQDVADRMHRAWVDFARTGDPGWAVYRPGHRAEMRFGTATAVAVDPRPEERTAWDGLR